jgi:predicted enzyme related to lactoylglutathione lyase
MKMIQKMSHATIYCLNHDSAVDFYVNKLGMQIKTDAKMDNGFRWVTIAPKGQPDFEIALMEVKPGMMMDEPTSNTLRGLIEKGTFGIGVLETADVHATVKDLEAKGVRIMQQPAKRPYGIEALIKDDSGNWFSLCQH